LQIRSNGSGLLQFNKDNSGNVSIGAGGGNVGIGTETPVSKLDVSGTTTSSNMYSKGPMGIMAPLDPSFALNLGGNLNISNMITAYPSMRALNVFGPQGTQGVGTRGSVGFSNSSTSLNNWTINPSTDGKLCFALNGVNKTCINGNGSIVAPTVAYSA